MGLGVKIYAQIISGSCRIWRSRDLNPPESDSDPESHEEQDKPRMLFGVVAWHYPVRLALRRHIPT